MTTIYIMRHGEAGYAASSDADRVLTAYGQAQCSAVAKWFKQENIKFDYALVSPYVRAQQTFSLINDLHCISHIQTNKMLVPGGDSVQISNELIALAMSGFTSILVVSHLPLVGYLVNDLCPHVNPPMFATADVACVTISADGEGNLEWLHHPQ